MKDVVREGEERNWRITGENFDSLEFVAQATADSAATSIANKTIDWSKVNIDVTLNQAGVSQPVFNGDLLAFSVYMAIKMGQYPSLVDNSTGYPNGIVHTIQDTGVNEVRLVPLRIPLGGICLTGNDFMDVTVRVQTDAFHADADGASSVLNVSTNEVVTNQWVMPFFDRYLIETNKSRVTIPLGDNVSEIFLVNLDETDSYYATRIFDNLELKSDKRRYSKSWYQMVEERMTDKSISQVNAETSALLQNFCISSDKDLDNCQIDLTLNLANVAASQNYLIVKRFKTNDVLAARAEARRQRHNNSAVKKLMS